jgi:tRNA-dihydrouridine synthase 1
VCHFSASDPQEFAQAAKLCEASCDAIDLNLGCPQRTAYVGHFGSYLLGKEDRELVLNIVRAGVAAVSVPIFCKIRLLDTLPETMELCQQLRDAGASLIAIHARYRATFHRNGPGARDGPALLDQVAAIREVVIDIPIIANGNVITYEDVERNLETTKAAGIMSAEGILDNPALFLPRHGTREEAPSKLITIPNPSPLPGALLIQSSSVDADEKDAKRERRLLKKLREIERIETKLVKNDSINEDQSRKLATKSKVLQELAELENAGRATDEALDSSQQPQQQHASTKTIPLSNLYEIADDKLCLANEYLDLVRRYPIQIRTIVFHTRRMLKDLLTQYQLMEDCVASQTVTEVQTVLDKIQRYREEPTSFLYDREKAAREKEVLENKRLEESKRKNFEARMIRKAKREGKQDLEYYLRIGAEIPTVEMVERLRKLSKEEQLELWKKDHSQHCMSFHLDPNGCQRNRACAFLHVDAKGTNTFVESEEVAG